MALTKAGGELVVSCLMLLHLPDNVNFGAMFDSLPENVDFGFQALS